MLHFLKNILQLVINPTRGWEDVSGDASDPQELCRVGLYPMLAISALSCVGGLWKLDSDTTLIAIIQNAIITFTSFFATKFFAEFMMGLTMDKICDKQPSSRKNSTIVIYSLAILSIITIICNVVPLDLAVLNFLPIYVGYILFKSIRYESVAHDKQGHYMFLTIFTIILPPYLLTFIFNIIKP